MARAILIEASKEERATTIRKEYTQASGSAQPRDSGWRYSLIWQETVSGRKTVRELANPDEQNVKN